MGFANNLIPSSMLNAYIARMADSANYYVSLSTNTKESTNMYKTVELAHQTTANRKQAEDVAKLAAKGRKARAMVETVTYGDVPFASLTLENDHGGKDEDYNPRYMSVRLGADDLEALQNAVYAARVEIHKHTTKLVNPGLTATAW